MDKTAATYIGGQDSDSQASREEDARCFANYQASIATPEGKEILRQYGVSTAIRVDSDGRILPRRPLMRVEIG